MENSRQIKKANSIPTGCEIIFIKIFMALKCKKDICNLKKKKKKFKVTSFSYKLIAFLSDVCSLSMSISTLQYINKRFKFLYLAKFVLSLFYYSITLL